MHKPRQRSILNIQQLRFSRGRLGTYPDSYHICIPQIAHCLAGFNRAVNGGVFQQVGLKLCCPVEVAERAISNEGVEDVPAVPGRDLGAFFSYCQVRPEVEVLGDRDSEQLKAQAVTSQKTYVWLPWIR
jgi:hypothetical protein